MLKDHEMETLGSSKERHRDRQGHYPNNTESNGKTHEKWWKLDLRRILARFFA